MAENPLIGAYVKILYHTEFAPHVMTLPTNTWHGSDVTLEHGTFDTWAGGSINAQTMIEALLTDMAAMYNATTVFDGYEIWTRPSMAVLPRLRFIAFPGIAGTGTLTGWSEAVQRTYFMRDISNNPLKLVLLDAPTDNNFGKYFTLSTPENIIISALTTATNAWSTRARLKPEYFRALTITLNERLRREYHLR